MREVVFMNLDFFRDDHLTPDLEKTVTASKSAFELVSHPPIHGRFVRQSLLGRGGCGSVYRAFDLKLNREVAIKIPLQQVAGDPVAERTFRREVYVTSRLRHPYVVTLFDFEFNESEAILVYEFIDGETLHSWITKHPEGVEPNQAAEVVKKIALALQHAHSQNILHRDIKPSNILLDQTHAEFSDSLEPRLADFGLAQLLHDHTRTESNRELVGSIHYTPPEVIRRSADAYSRESDVYSLGTVLYELLTGQRPFTGSTIAEVLQKISGGDFTLPRQVNRAIPRDLEAICLRAMAIEPNNRYLTAELLAEDLERFLMHRPVIARHPGVSGILSRWIRRNPTLSSAIALSAVAITGFVLLVISSNHRLSVVNETISDTNRLLSEALKSSQLALFHNEQNSYSAAMQTAAQYIVAGRLRDARTVLNQYDEGTQLQHHRDFEWHHLRSQIQRGSKIIWQAKKPLYCIVPHDSCLIAAGAESQVTIVDSVTYQVIRQWSTNQGEVNGIAIDEAKEIIFTSGDDGSIVACDLQTGTEQWRVNAFADQRAYELVYCKDRERLYCLGHLHAIAAVDTTTRRLASNWTSPVTSGKAMRLLDESTLLVVSKRGNVFEISTENGVIVDSFLFNEETSLLNLCIVNTHQVAIATSNSLVLYDPSRNQVLQTVALVESPSSVTYDSQKRCCVVAMKEGGIHRFIEDENGKLQAADRWVNHGERLHQVIALPDGSGIVTADHSGAIRLWNGLSEDHVFVTTEDADLRMSIEMLPAASESAWPNVIVGCARGAFVYDFNHRSKSYLEKKTREVTEVKHWPGKISLLSSFSGSAIVLQHDCDDNGRILSTRRELVGINSHPLLSGSHDGRWIGGGSQANDKVWLKELKRNAPIVQISALNPHVLAILPEEDAVYWNNDTAIHFGKLSRPDKSVELVKFDHVPEKFDISADKAVIAIGLSNREVRLWDVQAKSLRCEVLSHPDEISAITFTPSSRSLLTLSINATLRCWNIQTGQLTLEKNLMPGDTNLTINSVSFTPDLRYVAFKPADRSLHMFRLFAAVSND